jgi:hypothetical protein
MRTGSIFWGGLILLVGTALLAGNFLEVDVWPYLFPAILMFAGVWFLFWGRVGRPPLEVEAFTIPLDGARRAEVKIRHGAGRLLVRGGGDPQVLASGTFVGGLSHRENRSGDLLETELRIPEDLWFRGGWMTGPWRAIDWDLCLNSDIPMRVDFETGAGENRIDLSVVKAEEITLKTGASSTDLTLPANAGRTKVKISSGVASVVVRVPNGVAANISVESGLAGIKIDERRFPRSGSGYTSPDYAQSSNAVDIKVETGVGSVEIS